MRKCVVLAIALIVLGSAFAFGQNELQPSQQNGKFGFKDVSGNWVIQPTYSYATPFIGEYAIVRQAKKAHIINSQGVKVKDIVADSIQAFPNQKAFAWAQAGTWKINDAQLQEWGSFTALKTASFTSIDANTTLASDKANSAIISWDKKKVNIPTFLSFERFGTLPNGAACFRTKSKEGKYGIVLADLSEFVKPKYSYLEPFQSGFARFEDGGKWGLLNHKGESHLPVSFEFIQLMGDSLAQIKLQGKASWVDLKSKIVSNARFDHVLGASQGAVIVANNATNGKATEITYALAGVDGKLRTDFAFKRIESNARSKDFKAQLKSGDWSVLKPDGNFTVISNMEMKVLEKYDYYEPFDPDGLSRVGMGKKWGFVNKQGIEVFKVQYDLVQRLGTNRYKTRLRGQEFMVDANCKDVGTATPYADIAEFSDGLARVAKRNGAGFLFGYIDMNGKLVIPMQYEQAEPFVKGKARVKLNGSWGNITPTNQFSK